MDSTEEFLKALTEAHGVSGHEEGVRELLRGYMSPLGAISQDKLGSLICHQPGEGPKVMLAGHMDEIGFMVTFITKEGYLNFVQLGGWWDQVLLGHRVVIKSRKGDVPGVIGAKPIHLVEAKERDRVVEKKDMVIDIGATSKEEVEAAGVRVGDPIIPVGDFVILANPKTYLAKALDDRVGCALMIDTLRHFTGRPHPNHIYGVATVMEEVGLRGATTSVRAIDPDVALILEVDIAGDIPGLRPEQSTIKLGGGPSMLLYDQRMIPNLKLRDLVIETAAELEIPLQLSALIASGTTDGAVIHLHSTGVPSVVISVPTRHIHSHGAIMHRDDYDNAVKLVSAVVGKLDEEIVIGLTG